MWLAMSIDLEPIKTCLRQQPSIVVAYLFGSQATGQARPDSDIDIAVLLESGWQPGQYLDARLRLMNELASLIDKKVDVVILNQASPLLKHHVLLQKQLLFERDLSQRVEFEVTAGKIYADLKPMYEFFWQSLVQRINNRDQQRGQRRRARTLEQARTLLERTARS